MVLAAKMRSPGTTISAVGHVGLIGWMLLGWGMNAAPLPVEVMDVSLISGEEFEELIAASTPEPGLAPPDTPPPPPVVETPPPPPPVVETPPAPPPPPPPPPPVADAPPSDTPSPPVADRIAAVPTPPPPPDAEIADTVRDAVVPDPATSAPVAVPEQAATALPETATEIAIADEAPRGAVERSIRPVPRPVRAPEPAPVAEPVAEVTPEAAPEPVPDTSADVAAALAAALTEAPAVPQGPPMTGAERDSFRIAVNRCWNVDPGSVAARVIVEVGFTLTRDGMVDGQPRLISSDGDAAATDTAFEAARRAILRCQSGGYQLPADKYDQWREVVITFDPSGMRLR